MLNKRLYPIRKFASSLSKRNNTILFLYNSFMRWKNKKRFQREIDSRANLDLFDYQRLIEPLPYYPIEAIKDSNFYGYVHAIKKYMNSNAPKITIEHGLYLDDNVSFYSNYKTFDTICTMSDYRLEILRKHGVDKRLMAIGPYIHYATSLLQEDELAALKKQLGKVVLYMPSHSTNLIDGTSPYFIEEVDTVEKFRAEKGFDTVIVCVYYRDFQYKKCIEEYQNKGFLITTAGHQLDLNFINRLKSIIQISDYTLSNRIGTNLGFCVYMGKPHIVINDYPEKYSQQLSGYQVRREIADAFKDYYPSLTTSQIEIVNKYWGINSIKSPDELNAFFNTAI